MFLFYFYFSSSAGNAYFLFVVSASFGIFACHPRSLFGLSSSSPTAPFPLSFSVCVVWRVWGTMNALGLSFPGFSFPSSLHRWGYPVNISNLLLAHNFACRCFSAFWYPDLGALEKKSYFQNYKLISGFFLLKFASLFLYNSINFSHQI